MLLSVFSGIAMFGFFGIIVGPVVMILIVTTISVYLAVYKGVEMKEEQQEDDEDDDDHKLFGRRHKDKAENDSLPESVMPVDPDGTAPDSAPEPAKPNVL
jgi:hypothetical protein